MWGEERHLHEECGVFGVCSPKEQDVASLTYYGLFALQHRGQESAGIVVNDRGVFSTCCDVGLVSISSPTAGSAGPRKYRRRPCALCHHRLRP